MRSIFVIDPIETLNLAGDSSYALMRESSRRGWECWWCHPNDLWAEGGRTRVRAQSVVATATGFERGEWREQELSSFQLVWMRKDPPFDMTYIFTTYLLDLVGPDTLVLNAPAALRSRNEKLFAAAFADLTPPTLISADVGRILAFAAAQPDRLVLKPWDGNGGRGVLVSRMGDPNLRSMIEVLSGEGRRYIIAQRYLPEIVEGAGDHRGNLHVGATARATTLTPREREICARIGPSLREEGMLFVGIDVIGPYLTEINVTSPTGLHEINAFDGVVLEAQLLDAAQRRWEARP
jgi:glutathione synthase